MAETGKLGTADSLLASVQLALAAADAAPPAITTQDGRLGWQLGNTALGINGAIGPLVIRPSAESVLALAHIADPAPTFVAHASSHWSLGGQDSRLGAMEPAFSGAEASPATPTVQTGRLGTALGTTVLGLDGVVGSHVFCMAAQSVLAIAQTADPAPTFVAHVAPHWVLGGQDSGLGGEQLAFAGTDEPRPATGDRTAKLGTSNSLLGAMRPALGEAEGGGGATIVYGTALSALALSSDAGAGIVRGRAIADTLVLTDAASAAAVRGVDSASELTFTDLVTGAAVREVAASDALDLTGTALGAAVFAAVAESSADLTTAADSLALRTLAAADTLELTDEAACTVLLALGAESAVEPATAADATAVRAVAAASALDLVDEAARTSRVIWTLSVESAISLASDVEIQTTLGQNLVSTLDLTDVASSAVARGLSAESAVSPATAGAAATVRPLAASSPATLTDAATGRKFAARAVESAIGLSQTAAVAVVRAVAATSALDVTDAAAGGVWQSLDLEIWDWLPIWDWAEVSVVRGVAAANTIALSQTEQTARPWYLSAESRVQTQTVVYNPATDKLVTQIAGLQDAASVARPLTTAVSQALPLGQSASVVLVKPTAIEVSAESVLELLGEIRPNQTGDTGNWLAISQTAAFDKCKTTRSTLALSDQGCLSVFDRRRDRQRRREPEIGDQPRGDGRRFRAYREAPAAYGHPEVRRRIPVHPHRCLLLGPDQWGTRVRLRVRPGQ